MSRPHFAALLLVVFALLSPPQAAAQPYSALYVFGDSLSDTGNISAIQFAAGSPLTLPADPYYQGRFSDGPVYAELVAAGLGLAPLLPSVHMFGAPASGSNYAVGGARSAYNLPLQQSGIPQPIVDASSIAGEVGAYISGLGGGTADSDALYIFFGGSDDMLDAVATLASGGSLSDALTQLNAAAASLISSIDALIASGVQHLLVMNVPDIGKLPSVLAADAAVAGFSALVSQLTQSLNSALWNHLNAVSGIDLMRFDTFALLDEIVADPSAYGLTNITDSCYLGDFLGIYNPANPSACSTPSQYLLFDTEHPSSGVHAILAAQVLATVLPVAEPSEFPLLALGLLCLAIFCQQRRITVCPGHGSPRLPSALRRHAQTA